ncbi:carbohydrate ABC transporter permease [Kineosporia sp. J2-2]|uniref:Carbohydrate ABC transporter permease n=1 Tax=Kineosporia corallincola TaxID=2835133 RepID=A0ABS5TNM9_9ACTN|nr:carbohydrate ABC transporter permease [Kineosporia corallincola]MBT0771658.1 carbohydrate ABC transporter permease [Kineosporia corallincola]
MTTDTSVAPPVAQPPQQPASVHTSRRGVRSRIGSVLRHALLILAAFVMLYPLLWMIASSLRPDNEIFSSYGIFVNTFDTSHYPDGWNALAQPFSGYLLNSAIVVLGAILGNLVSCSMAAYAFARLDFPFKRSAFAVMLLTIMLPVHVVIVPQYILWANLDLINTFVPLILPKWLATDAFFIFLMVQFIRGIPRELDEAARIDGAGHARIFLRIILPLMVPALATTTIFTFIWTWNDFFTQLIFLTDPNLYTVPVALRSFIDAQENSSYGSLFAMSVVSLIPIFLAFLLGQRYLIQGIATTGGK